MPPTMAAPAASESPIAPIQMTFCSLPNGGASGTVLSLLAIIATLLCLPCGSADSDNFHCGRPATGSTYRIGACCCGNQANPANSADLAPLAIRAVQSTAATDRSGRT